MYCMWTDKDGKMNENSCFYLTTYVVDRIQPKYNWNEIEENLIKQLYDFIRTDYIIPPKSII